MIVCLGCRPPSSVAPRSTRRFQDRHGTLPQEQADLHCRLARAGDRARERRCLRGWCASRPFRFTGEGGSRECGAFHLRKCRGVSQAMACLGRALAIARGLHKVAKMVRATSTTSSPTTLTASPTPSAKESTPPFRRSRSARQQRGSISKRRELQDGDLLPLRRSRPLSGALKWVMKTHAIPGRTTKRGAEAPDSLSPAWTSFLLLLGNIHPS
jgi:hypothetical protein